MIEHELKVTIKNGLHARPASELVKKLNEFACSVEFFDGKKQYNAKSILGLMSASIREGQKLKISVDGPDEEQALKWLTSFL